MPRHPPLARLKLCFALLLTGAWPCSGMAQGDPALPAAPPAALQRVKALGDPGQRSFQLRFSPQGSRFARSSAGGIELWQVQPLQLLGKVTDPPAPGPGAQADAPRGQPLNAGDSMRFDAGGWLHYVAESTHAWLTPELQRGVGTQVAGLSADGRYALRTGSVGNGGIGRDGRLAGAGMPPQYPSARDDIYDLREKRSVCQLPPSASADRMSVGGHWLAVQEAMAGPSNPRPLLVCDLAKGQVFAMPFAKADLLTPTIDPQGRWMAVTATGTSFFGGTRVQTHLYALPLQPADFAVDARRAGCEALPCGEPKPLPTTDAPPAHAKASPDGKWLVGLLVDPHRAVFFDTGSMKTAASLDLPPHAGGESARRIAFSGNGRWMALQAGERLYLVDLRAAKPELTEVRPDTAQFQLQDIDNDGVHWLMHYRADPNGPWMPALWRLNR